ncbi:metallopeptidase family protein [Chloroflexota bacterium]
MKRERFESLVAQVIEELPGEFVDRLDNIVIVVEDYPTSAQKNKIGRNYTILGLYEGVPLTKRGVRYGLIQPDKITIFRKPIEAQCSNDEEIVVEIQKVVLHEIAHYFGISEAKLRQIEKAKAKRKKPHP